MCLWPKKWWSRAILSFVAVLVLPYLYSRVGSQWRLTSIYLSSDTTAPEQTPSTRIRIACYHIAHGRGVAESNWDGGTAAERLARLDSIAALLQQNAADVVVLNEVDFDCSWSHSMDQARYIADKAGYSYVAEQRNLDFRVLFWTWTFGNAVLSKYPIANVHVVQLPGYSALQTLFGGKKRAVVCDVAFPDRTIRVIGAHLSAKTEAVRVSSARMLLDVARGSDLPTILAGDLNSTPSGFPESEIDGHGNNAIQTFDRSGFFQGFQPELPLTSEDLTFHSVHPEMVIDWILIPSAMYLNHSS